MPTRKSIVPRTPQPADTVEVVPNDKSVGQLRVIGGSHSDRFNNVLVNAAVRTLWHFENEAAETRSDKLAAAIAALNGFAPQNEVEGMLAAQAIGLHAAAMECLRRAMIPDQPAEIASKLRRDGANLARAMVDMCEALDRRRGKGQQTVVVKHVRVEAGGQAIVGSVTPGPRSPAPGEGV